MRGLIPLLFIGLFFSSCTGADKTAEQIDQEIQAFIKKQKFQMTKTDSGVYVELIDHGHGYPIRYNDQIIVTYRGEFLDRTVFDERTKEIEFTLANLIPAWKEVLVGQNVGAIVRIIVPPSMGYGDQDNGSIPPNSILHFIVHIKDAY
jgi:FKBP-type peptidyl-prolyl cis-trans isomerase FkpA